MGVSVIIRSLQEPVGRRRAVLRALCASRVPMSIAAIAGKLGVHPTPSASTSITWSLMARWSGSSPAAADRGARR